jgi:sugar lactone lactonase YvrE
MTITSRVTVAALVAVVGIALPSAPARAETPARDCAPTVMGTGAALHPEGVAYDPARRRFLVGSVTHGTVSVVGRDGVATTLVDDPWLVSTMGIAVDPVRRRVLVTNIDLGRGDRSSPDTVLALGGIGAYDLRTGAPLFRVDLAALTPDASHAVNDVTIGPDGTAYVTDSLAGAVYRVDPHGRASVLVRAAPLAGSPESGWGLNGIAWAGHGTLLAALSAGGALVRIPVATPGRFSTVTLDAPIGSPDGMAVTGPGTVAVVDNSAANRIVTLDSRDGWRTARLATSTSWESHVPTTLAVTRCGLYALDGRLDVLLGGGRSDSFVLQRFATR